MPTEIEQYDLIIIGGGASASFLCLQILTLNPSFKIVILEKESSFSPKIGESVVDQTALIIRSLGIENLLEKHAIKTGVRFIFNEKNSNQQADLAEFASPTLPGHIRAYHLNRALFDQDLLDEVAQKGVVLYRPTTILSAQFNPFDNQLTLETEGEQKQLKSRWVVDASGRAQYLKKYLNWKDLPITLNTGALTAHFTNVSPPEDWDTAKNQYWDTKSIGLRAYSTTHLMRKNAWWWIIKLDETTTSIGVVFDQNKHNFDNPEAYFLELIEGDVQLNKLTKHATHNAIKYLNKLPYSSEKLADCGQALMGDSGTFIDPFISPGLELIGQQAIWLAELLVADKKHEEYDQKAWKHYETIFQKAYQSRFQIYENAYGLMESYDLFSAWLKQGNFIYFTKVVYPSVLFKSRLKKPLRFNALERFALRYFARRFSTLLTRRKRQGRLSITKPHTISYSGVRVPTSFRFIVMPFILFGKAIGAYLWIEICELKWRFK